MVKKLFKYEFIYYFRTLGLFLPVIPILGIMVRIFRSFKLGEIVTLLTVGSSGLLCYLGAMALIVTTTILGIVRFYKNMYSAEGYLTFTLPVTCTQHILVKLITLVIFELLAFVSIGIGALIALSGEPLVAFFGFMRELFAPIPAIHGTFYAIELVLLIAVGIFSTPLLYYTCITIGQTAKKNRILLAVGVYFAYYTIMQVLTTIGMVVLSVSTSLGLLDGLLVWIESNAHILLHFVFTGITVFSAAICVLYYFVTHRIMSRKLNLE